MRGGWNAILERQRSFDFAQDSLGDYGTMMRREQGTEDWPCAFRRRQVSLSLNRFFVAPPLPPRYGIPLYLIAKELREGLIPFPYLVHTVCIPPIPCTRISAGTAAW